MSFFSVIIPVYKVEKYLCQCVDSILVQSFTDFEIILVDDGSPDNCPAICDDYAKKDSRIKVIHKENGGLSSARNSGIMVASGEFVFFIDSDDYYDDVDFFSRIAKLTEEHPSTDVISFSYKKYSEKDNICKPAFLPFDEENNRNKSNDLKLKTLISTDSLTISAWSKVVRRSTIIKYDLFFKQGIVCEDIDWIMRLFSLNSDILFINDNPYIYRIGNSNSISSNIKEKNLTDMYNIIYEYADKFRSSENLTEQTLLHYLSYQYSILCALLIKLPSCPEKKVLVSKIKNLKWLLNYNNSYKVYKVYRLNKIFGISFTILFLGLYIKYR